MLPSRDTRTLPYAIGDLQGCADSFSTLLERLPPGRPLRFVGDLVNRGPDSANLLRTIKHLPDAETVLGNHDIHLLAVAAGVRQSGRQDTLDHLIQAPDRDVLLEWVRHRPLALREGEFLFVHAGVLPQWTAQQVMDLAAEVEERLRGPNWRDFVGDIFGNAANRWHDSLRGIERHRVVINALTRLRFCTPEGLMDFKTKEGASGAPEGFMPWFDVPGRKTADVTVVCGHWSTLGLLMRPDLMALDTGCVWGGKLTAARLAADPAERTVVQVECPQYCNPVG